MPRSCTSKDIGGQSMGQEPHAAHAVVQGGLERHGWTPAIRILQGVVGCAFL